MCKSHIYLSLATQFKNQNQMNYFKRHIDKDLLAWKEAAQHKPLLLRGARQVGKSSAVRELGKQFKYFIEVNLERNITLQKLFGDDINIKNICNQLSAIYKTPVIPGETLIFIDEIKFHNAQLPPCVIFMKTCLIYMSLQPVRYLNLR